jgi:hypothetical protein
MRQRGIVSGLIGLIAIALMAGCGTNTSVSTSSAVSSTSSATASPQQKTTPTSTPKAKTTSTSTPKASATVGSTIDLGSSTNSAKFAVTLVSVGVDTNPNDIGSNSTLPANTQLYSVKLSFTGVNGTYSDDANNDATLVGSDKQSYTTQFDSITGCTNFNSGTVTVTAGQSSVGCVSCEVPNGVVATQFQYDPAGGVGGSTIGEWTIP